MVNVLEKKTFPRVFRSMFARYAICICCKLDLHDDNYLVEFLTTVPQVVF